MSKGVNYMSEWGSKEISRVALYMALSESREEENQLKEQMNRLGIRSAAVDYGGEFISSITKIIERAVVAAKRENVIGTSHAEEGAVAGAAREAIAQIMPKAIGLNVGGKIGIARYDDHISVALFLGIGMLNLNEISVGLGHRAI